MQDPRAALDSARRTIDHFDTDFLAPALRRSRPAPPTRTSKLLAWSTHGTSLTRDRRRSTAPGLRRVAQLEAAVHVFHAVLEAAAEVQAEHPLEDAVSDPSRVRALDDALMIGIAERVILATDPVIEAKKELVAQGNFDLPQSGRKGEVIEQLKQSCKDLGMPDERTKLVDSLIDTLVADCVAIQAHEIEGARYPSHLTPVSHGYTTGTLPTP